MENYNIVTVLRSGGDFAFRDVELISRHINMKWRLTKRPNIICFWDKASQEYDLGNIHIIPLKDSLPGTWSRIALYSPEMEKYRPFLYVDLDTAVIQSIENIFELIGDESMFITLEDFWQKGQLATGLVWFPANSSKVKAVWDAYQKGVDRQWRMDYFLRKVVKPDKYWQQLTDTIIDFKPQSGKVVTKVPVNANLICFHGKPRIFEAGTSSMSLQWITEYIYQQSFENKVKVSVIISYKEDRGWLTDAIESVPNGVQLLLSKGDDTWAADFNKVLPLVKGDYIKYLHEDDMIMEGGLEAAVQAIESQNVDFVHGNVFEFDQKTGKKTLWKPTKTHPTLQDLLKLNTIHSASLLYKREVFKTLGGLDPKLSSSEDWEFNLRCLQAGFKIGYCDSIMAIYRRHPNQKVRTTKVTEQERVRNIIRKRYSNE